MTRRPPLSSRQSESALSRIIRSQGYARLGRNVEPTGCSNTRLRISSRTSSAIGRWSSTVPSHFGCRDRCFGSRSPASTCCHDGRGSVVGRLSRPFFVVTAFQPMFLSGAVRRDGLPQSLFRGGAPLQFAPNLLILNPCRIIPFTAKPLSSL
jgi:hypothetical protein